MGIDQKIVSEALKQIDSVLREVSEKGTAASVQLVTRIVHLIERFAPSGSVYMENAKNVIKRLPVQDNLFLPVAVETLKALRTDYEQGHLAKVHELIHADLFSDFLEQAEYLLEARFKDPAAVISGGVLEEHLRKLCQKNDIDTVETGRREMKPKRASKMNNELKVTSVYGELDRSQVDGWLKLRNHAAHGEYGEYDDKEVANMISGIRNFVVRLPA